MSSRGSGLIVVLEAYFDESVQSRTSEFSMAGCVYKPRRAIRFTTEWRRATGGKPFHTKDERIKRSLDDPIWPRLANIITKHRALTAAFHLDLAELREVAKPGRKLEKLAYVACVTSCIELISVWQKKAGLLDPVSYVFASGHQGEKAADAFITAVLSVEVVKEALNYGGHAFRDANELELLQGADFAANYFSRTLANLTERGDDRPSGIAMKVFSAGKYQRNMIRTLTGDNLKDRIDRIENDWNAIFR